MAESPMIGCRVPQQWQQQIVKIASTTRLTQAEVVREAVAVYLGQTNPNMIKSILTEHHKRLSQILHHRLVAKIEAEKAYYFVGWALPTSLY